MDDKKEEIEKDLNLILIFLCGCPGNSKSDSSFKVFKSVKGYLSETVKALEKEDLLKLHTKEEDISEE